MDEAKALRNASARRIKTCRYFWRCVTRAENDGKQNGFQDKSIKVTILHAPACYIALIKPLKRMNVGHKSTWKSPEWQYPGTGSDGAHVSRFGWNKRGKKWVLGANVATGILLFPLKTTTKPNCTDSHQLFDTRASQGRTLTVQVCTVFAKTMYILIFQIHHSKNIDNHQI